MFASTDYGRYPAFADEGRRLSGFSLALTALFLIGSYVYYSPAGAPAAFAALAGGLLILKNISRIRMIELQLLLGLLTLTFLTIILKPEFWGTLRFQRYSKEYLESFILFVYSIVVCYGIYLELKGWTKAQLNKLFFVVLCSLLIGSTLEVLTPFKIVSDKAREFMFSQGLYTQDWRDLLYHGGIRPKLFTSEVSHLAKFYVFALVCWFVTSDRPRTMLIYIAFLIGGLLIIRSPIILLGFGFLVALLFDKGRLAGKTMLNLVLILLLCLVLSPVALVIIDAVMAERVDRILEGKDGSFFQRFLAPLQIMLAVLADHPVFGLGFGGKEAGIPYSLKVHAQFDLSLATYKDTVPLGANALFLLVMQTGVVGFTLFAILYWKMIRTLAGRYEYTILATTLLFMNVIGALNTVRIWSYIFILFAVCYACSQQRSRDEELPQVQPTFAKPGS